MTPTVNRLKNFRGVVVSTPAEFADKRGKLMVTTRVDMYNNPGALYQTNLSFSNKNVFRGMHLQAGPMQQGKVITVVSGKIIDFFIDLDPSKFGDAGAVVLEQGQSIYLPPRFAHGFLSLNKSVVSYSIHDSPHLRSAERSVDVFDKNIKWDHDGASHFATLFSLKKLDKLVISDKDANGSPLSEAVSYYDGKTSMLDIISK